MHRWKVGKQRISRTATGLVFLLACVSPTTRLFLFDVMLNPVCTAKSWFTSAARVRVTTGVDDAASRVDRLSNAWRPRPVISFCDMLGGAACRRRPLGPCCAFCAAFVSFDAARWASFVGREDLHPTQKWRLIEIYPAQPVHRLSALASRHLVQ